MHRARPADPLERANQPPGAIVRPTILRTSHRVDEHRLDDAEHPFGGVLAAAVLLSAAARPHQAIAPRFELAACKIRDPA